MATPHDAAPSEGYRPNSEIHADPNGQPESDEDTQADQATDWEKRYKDLQSYATRVAQDSVATKQELAELRGRVEGMASVSQNSPQPAAVDPFAEWETEEWQEDVDATPHKIALGTKTAMQQMAAAVLERDAEMRAEIHRLQQIVNQRFEQAELSPQLAQYKDQIDNLRKDPELAQLPDRILLKMVSKTVGAGDETVSAPPAGPSGSPPKGGSTVKITPQTHPMEWKLALQIADGNEERAKRIFANTARRIQGGQ